MDKTLVKGNKRRRLVSEDSSESSDSSDSCASNSEPPSPSAIPTWVQESEEGGGSSLSEDEQLPDSDEDTHGHSNARTQVTIGFEDEEEEDELSRPRPRPISRSVPRPRLARAHEEEGEDDDDDLMIQAALEAEEEQNLNENVPVINGLGAQPRVSVRGVLEKNNLACFQDLEAKMESVARICYESKFKKRPDKSSYSLSLFDYPKTEQDGTDMEDFLSKKVLLTTFCVLAEECRKKGWTTLFNTPSATGTQGQSTVAPAQSTPRTPVEANTEAQVARHQAEPRLTQVHTTGASTRVADFNFSTEMRSNTGNTSTSGAATQGSERLKWAKVLEAEKVRRLIAIGLRKQGLPTNYENMSSKFSDVLKACGKKMVERHNRPRNPDTNSPIYTEADRPIMVTVLDGCLKEMGLK